jgi:hypothetical protein
VFSVWFAMLTCSSLGLLVVPRSDLYCSGFGIDGSFGFVLFRFGKDGSVGRVGYGRFVGFGSFVLWVR